MSGQTIHNIRAIFRELQNNNQFRNSVYIIAATGIMSAFGFFFWIICSHLYTPDQIGIATSFISITALLSALSLLGLNNVIIRFLSKSRTPDNFVATIFFIVTSASTLVSVVFIFWMYTTNNPVLTTAPLVIVISIILVYTFLQATGVLFDAVFIAHRNTKYILVKNTVFSTIKLILPIGLVYFGTAGIIYSTVIATFGGWITGLFIVSNVVHVRSIMPNLKSIDGMRRFASGNFLGNTFSLLPTSILPLIITSRLGAKEAAFFYIPYMIVTFINVIPSAISQSLFAEASHNEDRLVYYLQKALQHLFFSLVPTALLIGLFGSLVLALFGPEYENSGTQTLRILVLASIIGSLNYFGDTLLNIKKLSGLYVFMNAFNAIIIVALAYVSAPHGLTLIALSSLAGQIATLLVYLALNRTLVQEVVLHRNTPPKPNY